MAASAVLPLQSGVEGGASGELCAALEAGWQSIAPGSVPLMVFRLGRANPPSLISGRQPLEHYLIEEESQGPGSHM